MGVIQRDLKEGLRVFVEGYLSNNDGDKVKVASVGYVISAVHIADNYVKVRLDKGPNGKQEVMKVPVSNIFYISQK